jgi:hypothetical protein
MGMPRSLTRRPHRLPTWVSLHGCGASGTCNAMRRRALSSLSLLLPMCVGCQCERSGGQKLNLMPGHSAVQITALLGLMGSLRCDGLRKPALA